MKVIRRFWCALVVFGVCMPAARAANEPTASEPASGDLPDATELVREVRASEQWIHRIKSLQVTYTEVRKRSDVAIAGDAAALKTQGQSVDPNINWQLRPAVKSSSKVFFDGKRFRYEERWEGE